MKNTLFVNAYGDRIQIAIISTDATDAIIQGNSSILLSENTQPVSRNMTATFLPMVKRTLDDAGVTLQQVTHILAIVGPGSYTGLRIALASMLGISDALGIPMNGISTNDAFALSSKYDNLSVAVGERFGYVVRSYHFADVDADANANSIADANSIATDYTLISKADLMQLHNGKGGSGVLIVDENPASTPRAKRNAVPASPDATASPALTVGETGSISPLAIVSHPALSHLLVAPTPFYSITNPYEPPQQKSV